MAALRILGGRIFRTELSTRIPFRYGIATVTNLPHVFVELDIDVGGETWTGIAADHLAPKWFTKNPDTPFDADIAEMLLVIRRAVSFATDLEGATPFSLWRTLYDTQAAWGKSENLAPLLTNFGTSLVERALLDAFCKAHNAPLAHLIHTNELGIDWEMDADFAIAGSEGANLLSSVPLPRVRLRHTVGLSDPLTDADIAPADRLHDGLPQSLEACIKTYGLTHFKLKVGGNGEQDAERLAHIVQTIKEFSEPNADWAFSVDGNESFRSLSDFRTFWQAAQNNPVLRPHLEDRLLFVEQPLHRNIALSDEAGEAFAAWPDQPPIIIDESDADFTSLPRALRLGYAGTSHKNCKGVFKGIRNAAYLARLKKEGSQRPNLLLSGEDLSNVGPVALLQDLAVQAALGIESVERNGQHYFAGLSQFPQTVQEKMLQAHDDLYVRSIGGWPTLRVSDGWLDASSLNAAPFGVGADVAPETWAETVL